MMMLAGRLPGTDGSRSKRRFEKVAFRTCKELPEAGLRPDAFLVLKRTLMGALVAKAEAPECPETTVARFLSTIKRAFSCPATASASQRLAAKYLPTTYKEVLTLIERLELLEWPPLYNYDICSACACAFRGPHRSAQVCPAPGCGRTRNDAKRPALKLAVRDPRDCMRAQYRCKTTATLLKTWPERCNTDQTKLQDVQCSRLFHEQILNDPHLRIKDSEGQPTEDVDPHHLYGEMSADAFQVWAPGLGKHAMMHAWFYFAAEQMARCHAHVHGCTHVLPAYTACMNACAHVQLLMHACWGPLVSPVCMHGWPYVGLCACMHTCTRVRACRCSSY